MSEEKFTELVSLKDINDGAITDLFDREYKKLLNDLGDENTSWKVQREITVKLKVRLTSESREGAISSVDIALKLAPPKPHEQIIQLDTDGHNVMAFARKTPENQLELDNVTEFKKAEAK